MKSLDNSFSIRTACLTEKKNGEQECVASAGCSDKFVLLHLILQRNIFPNYSIYRQNGKTDYLSL